MSRAHQIAAATFAVFLVGSFVIVAATLGIGDPSVPADDAALVEDAPNGGVTKEEFDRGIAQTAKGQGIKQIPGEDTPEYQSLKDATMSTLLLTRWIGGEAEERGITVSETEVNDALQQFKRQNFQGDEQRFNRFLKQQGYTLDEALAQFRAQLLLEMIQKEVVPNKTGDYDADGTVSSGEQQRLADDRELYYEQNATQFKQPETRDVRLILNKDQAKVEQAKAALGADPTAADWKRVAKKLSTDPATKSTGGLRKAVAEGQSEPTLDKEIFDAATGEIVGPFKSETGYYLIQVEKVTPEKTTKLSEVQDQIDQQVWAIHQQQVATEFEKDFVDKWTSRSFCADAYVTERCANFEPPATECPPETADKQGCPAPVPSTRPVAPGETSVFGAPASGAPQGPIQPSAAGAPGGTPIPLGTPGAPTPTPVPGG